jgi:hypothetical protein
MAIFHPVCLDSARVYEVEDACRVRGRTKWKIAQTYTKNTEAAPGRKPGQVIVGRLGRLYTRFPTPSNQENAGLAKLWPTANWIRPDARSFRFAPQGIAGGHISHFTGFVLGACRDEHVLVCLRRARTGKRIASQF